MPEVAFAVPGDLDAPTGGYAYARKLLELLPAHGIELSHVRLPAAFPDPAERDLAEAECLLAATSRRAILLVDGLAYGALPAELIRRVGRTTVALVHHPIGLETGLTSARQADLIRSERAALAQADRVIASSAATARLLARDFGVPTDRLAVAEPGTEPAPRARGTGAPAHLLAVGAISPRKGYDVLVEALGGAADLDWRLTVVGAADRAPAAAAVLRAAIAASGLGDRIELAGAVAGGELARLYDRADMFVSASLFEGYGMVLGEAMARGLPLVVATGGAAAETVPDGAGLKVPPGDVGALRQALRRVIADPALRRRLGDASWTAGQALPRWHDTATRIARELRALSR